MRTRVKICCISSAPEARLAVAAGADLIGLVARMPSGPGPIPDDLIRDVAGAAPAGVSSVLLTSETAPEALNDHVARCRPAVVQIVDAVAPDAYDALRAAHPALKILQVIHVEDQGAIDQARSIAPHVDGLLLDSGRPSAPVKELGGTGRTHDWSVSARLVAAVERPVFLAGGLNAGNVAEAIRQVRPFGVDICSGVRTDGTLDQAKLTAFMGAVRAA